MVLPFDARSTPSTAAGRRSFDTSSMARNSDGLMDEVGLGDNELQHVPRHPLGATKFSTPMWSPAGMHVHTPLVSTHHDDTNDVEMLDEDEDKANEDYNGENFDYGDYVDQFGGYNGYGDDEDEYGEDEYAEDDYVDGRTEQEMTDAFLHGEENRKFRSKAWNEFRKVRVARVVVKGQCKHCNALITAKRGSGTSAMRNHLKRCKPRKWVVNVVNQLSATVMSPEGIALKDWKFSQEVSRAELVCMIVLHELPFLIVEYDGFRKFVSSLNPLFKMISRRTVTIDCLKSFEENKQALQEVFKDVDSRVSLTMDMWSSNQTLGYMCITCHCIDSEWKMRKRILKFSFLKSPHTGVVLFNAVLKFIQEWHIEEKLFVITLDNASNNNKMMKLLKKNLQEKQMLVGKGRLLHHRCAAHVLNLICQAGFQVLNPIIHKIRESVKYVQGSQSRKQKFDEELSEAIKYMQKKFKKYWKLTWLQISVPVLLDPRFKSGFIEFRLSQAFGHDAASKIALVKKVFLELFQDYSQLNVATQEVTHQGPNTELTTLSSERFSDWDNHMSLSAQSSEVPTELEAYFAKPPIPRGGNFDILAWWKSNSLEYPTLSRMARDILVVPASTVASEPAFGTGGRVISDFRSRLAPKTVEALVCLQDWMRASGSSQLRMDAIFDNIEEAG